MSKKRKWIILLILSMSICGFFIFEFIEEHNLYSNIIKSSWNIELPSEYKEIYSKDSGESFLGDGQRYHIFEYGDNNEIDKTINWEKGKNTKIEFEINEILEEININKMYSPNLAKDYKYYIQKDKDFSELYIIFFEKENRIYVIENIF